ncbi:MAG: small multi-drug export protein [Candidatus Aenigmarchaeota archaeon]|nr:small multi-drug export protein [Candidatus Aenigmarchaeota archaeon]
MIEKIGLVIITTLLPFIELRGSIPLALSLGLNPILTLVLTVLVNSLLFFPIFFGLKAFYDVLLSKIKFSNGIIERVRRRGSPYVEKYGLIGLAIFVAIPAPFTGVYSGTILGWLLNLEWKKAFLAVAFGAFVAGLTVLGASLGLFASLALILK